MEDFNNNQNSAFGGIQFNGENNGTDNTSYFDGTNGVYGNYNLGNNENVAEGNFGGFQPVAKEKAITKQGLWTKIKTFLFQEIDLTAPIKIELTPYQQKVEDEINEFLHQEVTFKGIANLFKKKSK